MTRAIVLDGEIHLVKPDSHESISDGDNETFCGIEFTDDEVEDSSSGLHYADHLIEKLATNDTSETTCEDCKRISEEWAV